MTYTPEQKKNALANIKLFVLDMDGTFYLGNRILDGSLDFLNRVAETGRQFIFFTNNSSKTPADYVQKLAGMDCHVDEKTVMTSGTVTIRYLHTFYPGQRVYLMGTQTLCEQFRQGGIQLVEDAPDVVVIGFDTELTYAKLEKACTYIRGGAVFLATHKDINCPTEDGFIPDCGSMCALIEMSTGQKPRYLGKPAAETAEMVYLEAGVSREQVAFVGDRIYTDVATGVNNGAGGFLVLTGETTLDDVPKSSVQPTCIFDSLAEMSQYL